MNPTDLPPGGEHARTRPRDLATERRPGVPMRPLTAAAAPGAHVPTPSQRPRVRVTKRKALAHLPPVFGTGQPPRALSGLLRRAAYRIPEHLGRHWFLLMFADRVDVLEHRLVRAWPLVALVAGIAVVRHLRD